MVFVVVEGGGYDGSGVIEEAKGGSRGYGSGRWRDDGSGGCSGDNNSNGGCGINS